MPGPADSSQSTMDKLLQALQSAYDAGYTEGVADTKMQFDHEVEKQISQALMSIVSDGRSGGYVNIDRPIEVLELNNRTRGCLKRGRINTIRELLGKQPGDLLAITNFGYRSFVDVLERLQANGIARPITWKDDPDFMRAMQELN